MSIFTHTKSGLGGAHAPEATQFIQAQAGCAESLNQLMARHDGLVQAVVRQQVLGELPFEEALQAGRIGLWRAIPSATLRTGLGFDPSRGFAFSTVRLSSRRSLRLA
jgi:DNA-directed RNA polymerase sigma subunit (sigma70/sigma32)